MPVFLNYLIKPSAAIYVLNILGHQSFVPHMATMKGAGKRIFQRMKIYTLPAMVVSETSRETIELQDVWMMSLT
jgi:hypothetical protein